MRNSFLLASACFFVLLACNKPGQVVVLTNDEPTPVNGKRLVIDRSVLPQTEQFFILKDADGAPVPVQMDDLDGDGAWDEMVFEYSLEGASSVELALEELAELPDFPPNTNAYLGHSPERNKTFQSVESNRRPADHVALSTPYLYQYEGPGWESELVGFRTYFDSRNGKDIFGKTKPQLYMENIGLGEDYHSLQDWGMDVLKVGNSLGAGALALLKGDSIYRLGDTDEAYFRIVTEGPVRSIIELKYKGWEVAGQEYDLTETITIWAGKRSYTSEVVLEGGNGADTLVTGIVDLIGVEKTELQAAGHQLLYTHGVQSENKDNLGMGILVADSGFVGFGAAPKEGDGVTNTYTALLKPEGGRYKFHFFVGWELEDSGFADREFFEQALVAEAQELNQNIDIKVSNK